MAKRIDRLQFWPAVATFGFVASEAIISFFEGTFVPSGTRNVHLAFLLHGGALFDLLIFPYLNGLLCGHLRATKTTAFLYVFGGASFSTVMHIYWYEGNMALGKFDWVWPTHSTGVWWSDISIAGIMHLIFMAVESAILFSFVFSPISKGILLQFGVIMSAFPLFGAVATSWMLTGKALTLDSTAVTLGTIAGTWAVVATKYRRLGKREFESPWGC